MALTSSELKDMLFAAGLDPTGKSVKQMKEALMLVNWAKLHPGEEFPDQFDPMLAQDVSRADRNWIKEQFPAKDWIIQRKMNGMRSILNLRPDGTVYMTSRERSKKDFAFTPHHDKVLGFRDITSPWTGKTVFDGELMMENPRVKLPSGVETTSTLQSTVAVTHMNAVDAIKVQEEYGSLVYNAFDILMLNGESTEDLPYEERLKLTNAAIDEILKLNPEAPIKPTKTVNDFEDAYEVFQEFIKNGEEGIMLKRRSAKYQQGKRSKDLLKIKGMQTVDAWVSGFVPATKGKGLEDYIGGFKFTTNLDGKEHEVAAVSNIDMATRKAATVIDANGEPTLNPEWLNKCAELVGQDFNEKSLRLNSARINEWRDDKTSEECSLRKEEMKFNGQIDEQ